MIDHDKDVQNRRLQDVLVKVEQNQKYTENEVRKRVSPRNPFVAQ